MGVAKEGRGQTHQMRPHTHLTGVVRGDHTHFMGVAKPNHTHVHGA